MRFNGISLRFFVAREPDIIAIQTCTPPDETHVP